jgi:hypothetical protein
VPFIYRNLTIKISTRKKLRDDTTTLTENRPSQKCLKYTRRLELKGRMPLLERDVGEEPAEEGLTGSDYQEPDESFDDDNFEPRFNGVFVTDPQEDGPDESSRSWSPLISLISSLQYLTDLIYACDNQVPPCLLQALHRHHPACRLAIRTFRFRSLRASITDPNELALVTSPCLHSLSVRYVWRDSGGNDDYNEEAVLRSVALAPNLKQLDMLGCRPASSQQLYSTLSVAKKPWKGFSPPVEKFQIGSLRSLSFCGYQDITKAKLDIWNQHTDLSKLRSLVLSNVSDAGALMNATVVSRFKSLERLAMHLCRKGNDVDFIPAVEMFFDCLSPLTTLRLYGSVDASLVTKILERHGSTLRELLLKQYEHEPYGSPRQAMVLTNADIEYIRNSCPLLEDLKLSIKRSKSDWRETQCYEALGTFASLTKLGLQLDCSNLREPGSPSADEDSFDRQLYTQGRIPPLYNAHIRDALINSAVDEALARSIWDVVSISKPGRPLMRLRITSGGGSGFGQVHQGDLSSRVGHMSRSFLLTRSERDDCNHVEVIELGKQAREQRDERERHHEAEMMRRWGHTGNVKMTPIFERLWPPKLGSRDWRDDWSSQPLQRTVHLS